MVLQYLTSLLWFVHNRTMLLAGCSLILDSSHLPQRRSQWHQQKEAEEKGGMWNHKKQPLLCKQYLRCLLHHLLLQDS